MLEGDLSDFTLPDILRLLAFTSKTGRLRIEGERFAGRVDLVDGRVRDASADAQHLPLARRLIGLGHADGDMLVSVLEGRETLPTDVEFARELVRSTDLDPALVSSVLRDQAVDAVFDLLRWDQGSFRFEMHPVGDTSPPDLDLKVDDVLAEADRRLEAWSGIEQRTGAGSAVVSISRPSDGTPDIDADGWGLLGLVDGHRTVDDLVSLSGRGQFETRQLLGALVDLGVVTVGAPGRGGAVEQLIEDHRAIARVESSLADGGPRPGTAAPDAAAMAPGHRSAPREPAPAPEPSAQRADAGGWPSDKPSELPVRSPGATAPSGRETSGGYDTGPAPEAPPQASSDATGEADETPLRMRVRSERLTTDPSIDADLVTRLIDGVEGL